MHNGAEAEAYLEWSVDSSVARVEETRRRAGGDRQMGNGGGELCQSWEA